MDERVNCFAMLSTAPCVILKTESTGIDTASEIVEISVIDLHGQVLLNTLVRPQTPLDPAVTRIHAISNKMVEEKPTFPEVWPQVLEAIKGKLVVIYNAEYHLRMLLQTCNQYEILIPERFGAIGFFCCRMEYQAFAQLESRTSLVSACCREKVPLPRAHRALGNCYMTLFLIDTVLRKIHRMRMQIQ